MSCWCFLLLFCSNFLNSQTVEVPHIIWIFADDLGWATLGYHDSEVQTPFIDALATNDSLILSRHYTYKYCSPTRASFLSGRLPLHVNEENREVWQPGGGIHLGMYTMPHLLKLSKHPYHTHFLGKWHCGMSNANYLPINRGFDTSFGYLGGAENQYQHTQGGGIDFWTNNEPINNYDGVYGDLLYNQKAVETIKLHSIHYGNTEPLFMYYNFQAVHDPQQVPQQYLDLYPANMSNCFSASCNRRSMDAMASLMDSAVQNITATLKSTGLWNSTLLIFAADNGGASGVNTKSGNNWPLRGGKHSDFEGGVRAAIFVSGGWLPAERRGKTMDSYIHVCDWYETFAVMVGVNISALPPLTNESIPQSDSMDIWQLIDGSNETSPRTEIALSSVGSLYGSALISGNYKIVMEAQHGLGFFTGPQSPNTTVPFVDAGCPNTCLFDIINDPTEHIDLSDAYPDIKQELLQRIHNISAGKMQTDCYGKSINHTQAKQNAINAQINGTWAPYDMCLMLN